MAVLPGDFVLPLTSQDWVTWTTLVAGQADKWHFLSTRFSLFLQTEEMFWRRAGSSHAPFVASGWEGHTSPCGRGPWGLPLLAYLHGRPPPGWLPLGRESRGRPGNTDCQHPWPRELRGVCGFSVTQPFQHHPPSCPRYESTVVAQHPQKGNTTGLSFCPWARAKRRLRPQQPRPHPAFVSGLLRSGGLSVQHQVLEERHLLPSPPLPSPPALTRTPGKDGRGPNVPWKCVWPVQQRNRVSHGN